MSDRRTKKDGMFASMPSGTARAETIKRASQTLSEGGCYVDTMGQAHIGEVLAFKLQLPDGEWLALRGEVAHQTPPLGFGLRFVTLSDEQREKLLSIFDHAQPISS
jgi:hypothetical protein